MLMKADIPPKTHLIKANCACGASFNIESTLDQDITLEVCSQCHPFYTGKKNLIDTAGRVDKFKERLAKTSQMKEAVKAAAKVKKTKPTTEKEKTDQ